VATSRTSTYLRTHRLAGKVLAFSLDEEARALQTKAGAAKNGRAAKTIVKEGPLNVTVVALKKGAKLQRHQVDEPVTVHVLKGKLDVSTADGDTQLAAGGLVAINAGVAHSATAAEDADLLITVASPAP